MSKADTEQGGKKVDVVCAASEAEWRPGPRRLCRPHSAGGSYEGPPQAVFNIDLAKGLDHWSTPCIALQ